MFNGLSQDFFPPTNIEFMYRTLCSFVRPRYLIFHPMEIALLDINDIATKDDALEQKKYIESLQGNSDAKWQFTLPKPTIMQEKPAEILHAFACQDVIKLYEFCKPLHDECIQFLGEMTLMVPDVREIHPKTCLAGYLARFHKKHKITLNYGDWSEKIVQYFSTQ